MTLAPAITARFLRVTGVVQGVGFRPFVYRLATRHSLSGWVRNVAGTVEIHIEGDVEELEAFQEELRTEAPPIARIDALELASALVGAARDFRIVESADAEGIRPVTPDLAMCAECEAELFDPANRRFRHPFITCTNCGPRYTIVRSLPYDRERISMAAFRKCALCDVEYHSPTDRRYHAETVACTDCGPRVWLVRADGTALAHDDGAIREAGAQLRRGRIVAVRGIGGFHLACDATNNNAVRRLRERKHRDAKPFAVMVRTIGEVGNLGVVSLQEALLLCSPERPVVLIERTKDSPVAASVSPGLDRTGVMIAYTPLHHLLLEDVGRPLVMTSGNLSDEPIAIDNDEALTRLSKIADLFLLHDREILSRVDDSVARVVDGAPLLVRRARGYAPLTLRLPVSSPRTLLAVGPHLKNTFTLVCGNAAHVSPHIGDLDSIESLDHFHAALARYKDLFRIAPEVAVRDLHPGYLSTRVAEELELEGIIAVQHHHAHIAAVAAEHGVTAPVVGLAFDGTGLGDDGNVWGAETLVADLNGYRRAAHLRYVPLPGGDLAARQPWRVALGYLSLEPSLADAFSLAFSGVDPSHKSRAEHQIERRLIAPLASSMGRLFDAASAVLGLRKSASYEGQAAMELEALAGSQRAEPLMMDVKETNGAFVLDPVPLLAALGELRQKGVDAGVLAARFHESVVHAATTVAIKVADAAGIGTVALGGGSFQNARLLSGIRGRLQARGLRVLVPRQLGPNDGAISFGQAAVAASLLTRAD
ncbi:MAG TPA: carbamoyltransferase HypF [Gemmatimonadaceae bacterium]|nr:carbamoyltransferase HypF [Gemmatimonadaceae bacterium]